LPEFGDLIGPVQAEMSALTPPPGSPFRDSLMPKTYGFLGLPGMDRQMSDYLVQQPIRKDGKGGQLMFGGGRHKARGYGVGVSDDSYVDSGAEHHLRSLPEQLNLQSDLQSPSSEPLNIEASWTGIIGSSTDGYPWVGGVPSSPGLFICAGYSGHGMTNAGLCGRHAARLLMTSVDGKDWVQLQNIEVDRAEKGQGGYGVPRQYVISKERMEAVVQKVSRTEHKL
jgi:glycine/D-amino acid oxidase-like deaminating enzyme